MPVFRYQAFDKKGRSLTGMMAGVPVFTNLRKEA